VLKAPLSGADLTIEYLIAATGYVTRRWKFSTPVSSTSIRKRSARVPCSTRCQTTPPTPASCSGDAGSIPAASTCTASRDSCQNGEIEETGLTAGVLGHPAKGIVWLAARLAENNQALKPGEILLSGSFIRPIEIGRADRIVAN